MTDRELAQSIFLVAIAIAFSVLFWNKAFDYDVQGFQPYKDGQVVLCRYNVPTIGTSGLTCKEVTDTNGVQAKGE